MIHAELIGDKHLGDRLQQARDTIDGEMRKATARGALKLLRHIKKNKLSGQVLNVISDKLRGSINQRVEEKSGSVFEGIVGTKVEYAARFEYGFSGSESVRAHIRNGKNGPVNVRAFTRNVNVRQRSFMRSALNDMADDINVELASAMRKVVLRVNKS